MTLFRKGLHIAGRQLVIVAGIVAALILLLIGSGAWLSQAVAERKDEIARWAGERTGYQIELGEAGLYWLDFFPKLMLADVAVLTPGSQRPVLQFNSLYIGVDLLKTLEQRQAVVDSVNISGLRLAVERDNNGQFSVRDLNWQPDKTAAGDEQWPALIAGLQHLQLQNISVDYQDDRQTSLSGHYQVNQAALSQAGDQLAADGNVTLPQHLGRQLKFDGELQRDGDNWPRWQIQADAEQLQFAPLLAGLNLTGVTIDRGRGDIRIMASKQRDEITADGLVRIQNIRLNRVAGDDAEITPVLLDRLETEFNWLQQEASWQLDLRQLDMAVNGEPWPLSQIRASHDAQAGSQLQTNYLRLSDLSAIAALSDKTPQWLTTYAPAGDVSNLQLALDKAQNISQLQASVNELAFSANDEIPGVSGLSFNLDWTAGQILAAIDSQEIAVYAENWLPETLYFDSLQGELRWQPAAQAGKLQVDKLQLVNKDLNIKLAGSLDSQQPMQADLTMNLADFKVASWLDYVPDRLLEPQFLNWARDAFVAGVINDGEIRLQGDPAAFPFDQQADAGEFSLQLAVSDVELDYGDGWSNLQAVSGQVTGSGNDLQISADSGQIAGFNFAGVTANISNLINGLPQLTLNGMVSGEAQQGLDFLQNSPLAERFGAISDWLQAEGNSKITLDLTVPLLDPDATQVNGEIALEDNRLRVNGLQAMPVEQLRGQLNFDNDGLTAPQLTALIADENADITIGPQADKTRIQINTAANVANLANRWQLDLPSGISGRSTLQANIDITEQQRGEFSVDAEINSDLRGIILDLPAPFNKSADAALPLAVQVFPEDTLRIELQLADWLAAVAAPAADNLRAAIELGQQTPRLPEKGIYLGGELDKLSVSDWQQWWQDNRSDGSSDFQVDEIDLRFKQLQLYTLDLDNVAVNVRRQPAVWQIQLAADQLQGDINWPASGDSLPTLHFDFVDLPLPGDAVNSEPKTSRPDLWPGFDLNIDNLTLDGMKLGRLQARAVRDALRWQLVSASLQSPTLQATASGDWRRTDDGDNTQLNLQLNSDDLANLLVDLGYQPAISARRVSVDGNFSWPDAPLNFSRRQLHGQMHVDVGSGQLKDVEPGAAGRIFGLLSFTAIPRRLSLDFSDLFGSGFGFSSIKGRFDFANGLATTNDLQMRGDSALVTVVGPVDLVERSYNQTVQITPRVASTLPLAGAVAGGPVGLGVGTAIFLVDKIADSLFDREIIDIINYRYQLTGPWDEPEMKLRKADEP